MVVRFFVLLSLVLSSVSFACEANCLACHPSLEKNGVMDSNHRVLKNCINCHTIAEDEVSHGACGADCWSCHDVKKISHIDIPEHKVLNRCIQCHVTLDREFFNLEKSNDAFSNNSMKKQLLLN